MKTVIGFLKKIGAGFKKGRGWISMRKATISSVLVILATILIFYNTDWQSQKSELQNNVLYALGMVTIGNSGYGANNSELVLYRSIAQECLNNPPTSTILKGGCGSNNFLLQEAAMNHDSLEGYDINATEQASTTLANYNIEAPIYDAKIGASGGGAILLLILSIVINSL